MNRDCRQDGPQFQRHKQRLEDIRYPLENNRVNELTCGARIVYYKIYFPRHSRHFPLLDVVGLNFRECVPREQQRRQNRYGALKQDLTIGMLSTKRENSSLVPQY